MHSGMKWRWPFLSIVYGGVQPGFGLITLGVSGLPELMGLRVALVTASVVAVVSGGALAVADGLGVSFAVN
jgi:hypothetical protein